MDRLKHLQSEAGASGDSTLDTTSPPSEAYMTVNDSSKYFSLSDSTFDTSPVKDVSLASSSASEPNPTVTRPDELMSSLSPIRNNDIIDTYKIGSQIEAANILSGGVEIFDDNDNSFDGDELVIDDNIESDDKTCAEKAGIGLSGHITGSVPPVIETEISADCSEIKESEATLVGELSAEIDESELPAVQAESIVASTEIEDPEPSAVVGEINVASREIGKAELPAVQAESSAANRGIEDPEPSVVVGEVSVTSRDIVESHEELNAMQKKMEEPELQVVDEDMNVVNIEMEVAEVPFEAEGIHEDDRDVEELEPPVVEEEANVANQEIEELEPPLVMGEVNVASREMEVVLQIDGNNVNAIDIGNGLYLYRRDGEQELAAIQIFGDDPHCNVKYLKVRDNAQGNLEVYEEIEVEVPKELPVAEKKPVDKSTPVPTNSHKEMSNSAPNKNNNKKHESSQNEPVASTSKCYQAVEDRETTAEPKSEVNRSGKIMKICESRKSPLVGSLAPMPFHSTPIKEGKPLTKTMVDLQLHPNRHSDIVKKTIEVHTDNIKPKSTESIVKISTESVKTVDNISTPIEIIGNKLKHTENNIKIMMPEKSKNLCMISTVQSTKPASTTEANETKDTHTRKSENQAMDIKSVECKQEPDNSKINLVKDTITSKLVVDENVKKEREDKSKPCNTVILPASSKNTNDTTIFSTLKESKQIENDKEKSVTDKKQLVLDKDIQQEKEIAKNITITETNIVETLTGGKVVENSTLKQSELNTALPRSPLESKLDSSLLNKDNNVVPEKVSEVINTPKNHQSEKLKVGMEINVFESLNSITASSTAKIKSTENKESDHAKDFVTKMSNVSSYKQKHKILIHTIKESNVEGKVDSRRNVANEGNCLSTCAETPKDINKSNSQKHNNTEEITIEQPIPVPNVNLVVKTASTPFAVESETLCVPSGKEAHPSPVFEIKSCHKDTCVLPEREIKLPEQASYVFPMSSGVNPLEKLAKSSESYVKPLEKTAQAHIIDLKPPEKVAQTIVVSDAKPTLKALHSITASKGKLSEKATSTAILIVKDQEPCSDKINKIGKHIGHIPVVANIASKPNSNIIPIILKSEDIKKPDTKEVVTKYNVVDNTSTQIKTELREVKEPISNTVSEPRPVNNNHTAAVPFGKWTDKNRQEFLNKFKEVKAPVHTNTKQIKNSNDLNRRDVLKKIDSQRAQTIINNATAKAQEKLNVKNEIVFSSKVHPKVESKIPVNKECVDVKPILPHSKVPTKQENPRVACVPSKVATKQNKPNKAAVTSSVPTSFATVETDATDSKTESAPRIGLSTATMANLIDKTIEGMINRVVPCKSTVDEPKESMKVNVNVPDSADHISVVQQITEVAVIDASGTLDDIEMKMNELHGIPFVERPPHELPKVLKPEIKTCNKTEKDKPLSKVTKIPDISFTSERQVVTENILDIDSEEEVIEHEPITGDIEINKKAITNNLLVQERKPRSDKSVSSVFSKDASNKGTIITETDFDKFARRNSITYEDCLTVKFEHKEPHNVVQTVKEKDLAPKSNETIRIDVKSKLPQKLISRHNAHSEIDQGTTKFRAVAEDSSNKNYHSKIHSAYQSLTAKHQTSAITIIEDKPVKVVFVESNPGFVPSQLNVQGQELSPSKQLAIEVDVGTTMNTESVDSDMLEIIDENKPQDKAKAKHQRKQVLTPVEEPELELIQPSDIGINVTPKKKRKTDDSKLEKQTKSLVHKKSYLLGRNTIMEDKTTKIQTSNTQKEILNRNISAIEHKDTASAIDSLVKAAELLENQTEHGINDKNITLSPNSPTNTPAKRGRGRPRKYPLPEEATNNKTPSPQKKPKLIYNESANQDSISDDHDGETSEDEMIRENWTMGKINENIVCPICNKLFRSENVVFKHVKHCTGVSPSRSGSDKQSPHRVRLSQESESISDMDYEIPVTEIENSPTKKRKSKNSSITETNAEITKPEGDKDDVIVIEDLPIKEIIVIEDTPMKDKSDKHDKEKEKSKSSVKSKIIHQSNNIVCEFCGKKFRQLSHLASHKIQHQKEQTKKVSKDVQNSDKLQVFSCNFCKKEFRKLHHLVQHRIIHNTNSVPKRTLRNSSLEQSETKTLKEETAAKRNEDPSTGFRCEPCDKSFRKLHHLVEHRETHDCINKQKPTAASQPVEPPQCEKNKKTFRKLQHLIEHKEQHAESSSDKSDDKSVKSALSTKDIIHECSLCYMVFPNEHSLNKHSVICSRKKRQSKQPKEHSEKESVNEDEKSKADIETDVILIPQTVAQEPFNNGEELIKEHENDIAKKSTEIEKVSKLEEPSITEMKQSNDDKIALSDVTDKPMRKSIEIKPPDTQIAPIKHEVAKSDENNIVETSDVPEKVKKINHKEVKIQDTPKKRTPLKEKVVSTVAKRQKTNNAQVGPVDEVKLSVESSDDDEVRYMLNPNFKATETSEEIIFMKVRAIKRNSLQMERPNSRDLSKRRTSMQNPPKIPRLKPETLERKPKVTELKSKALESKRKSAEPKTKIESESTSVPQPTLKHLPKLSETEANSTDSDDSDVKYSFPKNNSEVSNSLQGQTSKPVKKIPRKSLLEKRKVLGSIAKRKSLGKAVTTKHTVKDSPPKPIKKRTTEVEHRCDCGQLFSSAALLSRHTSLAHTPPRIRRRRDPSPALPPAKPSRAKPVTATAQPAPAKNSSVKTEASDTKPKPSIATRKSSVRTETTTPAVTRKSISTSQPKPSTTTRRSTAHAGVPVPEKMRKVMERNKK